MSTPKPGQIRCPTCLRSTPPAAFCTQCGSPIPPSARARPRGMDRDELEERVRRRPGEGPFRRGSQIDASPERAGYVPFEPEPEDSLAVRPEGDASVYGGPPPPDEGATRPIAPPPPVAPPPVAPPPPVATPPAATPPPPAPALRGEDPPAAGEPFDPFAADPEDHRPYGEPEDAYAYPYIAAEERGGGGGGGALPVIGFVVLCVLALAVGAVLAGLLNGDETAGRQSPSPSTAASAAPSVETTPEASTEPSQPGASATPEPSDGPVAFPDGAQLSIQPCATNGFRDAAVGKPEVDACEVDGSSVDNGEVWAFIVFKSTGADDTLQVQLRSNGQPVDAQELRIGAILSNCGATCGGLVYGPHYVGLLPGDYQLVLRRDGDFADRATFTVGG